MGFSVQKTKEADIKFLAQMNKELIQDEGSRNPMSLEQLEERMNGWLFDEWEIEIIQKDTSVIGYAVYHIRKDDFYPDEKYIYLRQFYMRREHRGKGYGTEALKHLIRYSFPYGAKVSIDVLESNARGSNFWKKFGFEPYYTQMKLSK
ncbi:GNAT family N-acetyltransferase [Paenibacillus lutrae]|uniref:GNAT family N-acetyltransferase n=1 Tax=Paenibacillus lutrae TaxID=2078573 RepID=A0A7X3FJF9_9BACL|nr:GNAT family N-acetyltransferase [Paenibacillus lutrae]MVP00830.1 GNAT family N-acetyltransferase [Paenibacillus lutrae]